MICACDLYLFKVVGSFIMINPYTMHFSVYRKNFRDEKAHKKATPIFYVHFKSAQILSLTVT